MANATLRYQQTLIRSYSSLRCSLLYLQRKLVGSLKAPEKQERSSIFRATLRERQGRTDRG
ncbi:hypothetical protein [Dolichospermum sp. UHCC 0259]|uniref:hypothetical protein n=1 Tax=Dolichospermum sp. UHCC 0259 TaxID=2590010 RepID=UPI001445A41F|nr:hypothetical protein [Dolichospermum sp. UHCC 0259]MTJ50098.1 hypothetical protein [Dolichospermum sp. UHCC 0259]